MHTVWAQGAVSVQQVLDGFWPGTKLPKHLLPSPAGGVVLFVGAGGPGSSGVLLQ